jgi:flagellar protein FliO/FliZ
VNDAEAPSLALQFAGTALALVIVLALAWLALRALARFQNRATAGGGGEAIEVLRSAGLGPRERLVAVRYRNREYLLGVTGAAVSLIDHWPAAAEPQPPRAD